MLDYDTAEQYGLPSNLRKYWDVRRSFVPIAQDVVDVHWTCRAFFDAFDPDAEVYIHGSFARGLHTEDSDVNLYIPSYTRKELEEAWSKSPMRIPDPSEFPGLKVSINQLLRDELGREVSICCADDPWIWVERDVKYKMLPVLEEGHPTSSLPFETSRAFMLNILRKCWYNVQSFRVGGGDTDTTEPVTFASSSDLVDEASHRIPSVKSPGYRFRVISNRICYLLLSVSKEKWAECVPEFPTIPSLIERFGRLADDADDGPENGADVYWDTIADRFETLASEICSFEDICFHT